MHIDVWADEVITPRSRLYVVLITVCVDVGVREEDFQAVDSYFSYRYRRMDEQVTVLRATWAGTPPRADLPVVGPSPVQQPGPPILAGSMGPRSIRRVSRWADGVYSAAMSGDAEMVQYFLDRESGV